LLTSLEYCEQAVALYRRSGALIGEGMSATNVGGVLLHLGRDQEAGETLTRALELNRRLGNLAFEVLGRAELGVLHLRTGDVPAALRCTRSALARSEELGSTRIRVDVLNVAGAVLLGTGQPEEAQEHHLLAQKLLSATLYRPGNVMTLLGLANVSLATCALDAARDFATKALAISRRSGFRLSEGEALNVLAAVCLAEGHFGDAATLAEQAQKMHEGTGYREGRDRAGRTLNHARHPSLAQRKAKHISTPT
jgi:tetratricopeptide (TPR) repeat protein